MADPTLRIASQSRWVSRLARATVLATFGLIVAGGLVTSRDAGLAVPDWPLSFGTLNPPRWYTIVNVRTEHGHRLAAACVALLTLILASLVYRWEPRRVVRRLALAAGALVLFQALLGGLRVLHLSLDLAMVHALTAQVFLAVVVVIATMTSVRWNRSEREPATSTDLRLDALVVFLVLVQLVLGILVRHLSERSTPLLGQATFQSHVALAMAITWTVVRRRSQARSEGRYQTAHRYTAILCLLGVQLALGLATFAVTDTMSYDRQATVAESWLPTFHVVVGAAILAAAVRSLVYTVAPRETRSEEVTPRAGLGGTTA